MRSLTCSTCGNTVYNINWTRTIGRDEFYLCSQTCAAEFDHAYRVSKQSIDTAIAAMKEEDQRKGADEQPGWKMHRWWNQTYKRKKDVWAQFKIEREFRRIQRKASRR